MAANCRRGNLTTEGLHRESDRLKIVMANPKAEKIWADAVQRAVKRRLENEDGKPQKIERLADKLVDFAMEGNGWAFKEIGERLDGKAPQAIKHSGDPDHPVVTTIERVIVKASDQDT
jgi:hypothetical protein